MIASLAMYARPELADAHDRYWALIRARLAAAGIPAPARLSQSADEWAVWRHPDLVLSQTCGVPYRTRLHDRVTLIGTPDYAVDGCPAGFYRSVFVVRATDPRNRIEDFEDAVFAYNHTDSQSGFAAAYSHVRQMGFWFSKRVRTGAHLRSAGAVAAGTADIASLDAVSWRLTERYETWARSLRVLAWTAPTPGLPLIAGPQADAPVVFAAVRAAIDQLQPDDRSRLGLESLEAIPAAAYMAVETPPASSGA